MKNTTFSILLGAVFVIAVAFVINNLSSAREQKNIKVGVIYVGDASMPYTSNFIKAIKAVEHEYNGRVQLLPKYNVPEGKEAAPLQELLDAGCDLIFSTSYGYGETVKEFARRYPQTEFCQATCANANTDPVLPNYHTFMGEIYQGRYISGVAAGMKLRELVDSGRITPEQAKIGYVAAFPFAEVISGYTAFFLGIRSVVPEAVMSVIYTNSWSSYALEKSAAVELINDGCVIISQHSDTTGPAVACENTDKSVIVYHISYNQSMSDVAPTTSLTGCRINWEPYFVAAAGAVLNDRRIEEAVRGNVYGNDVSAGFDENWVEMLPINEIAAANGTVEKINELIEEFNKSGISVFKGNYIGVDPFDENDVIDLGAGYIENQNASAPSFHYVLKDVISIKR